MKGSRKLVVYELHNGSIVISPTKMGKTGRFVQKPEGRNCPKDISDKELGKEFRNWLQKAEWSEKKK